MKKWGFAVAWAVIAFQATLLARGWERWDRCEFYEGSHSDGDSIEVRREGRRYVFRLYFVDCLEKNPASRDRRATQARYFGLNGASENAALRAAYLASGLTRRELGQPFTVYTRWQRVEPGSGNPAVRAFVRTASGKDLSLLLVSEGLAIIRHGSKAVSDHPDGRTIAEFSSALRRAESAAQAMKRGAWGLAGSGAPELPAGVVESSDREALVARAGSRLRVRGRVTHVGVLPGRMTFINFSDNRVKGDFVAIVRQKFLSRFSARFPRGLKTGLVGKHVVLEGTITLYRNTPQIELENCDQIRVEP
jgi:endonuclease YncB( thermonuclease family)